ncbi:hypothetical protein G7B40_016535 [Aetokthonos hydrillicola Thurmond2011]|jgi:predicted regulator of Ras-like GTPase activity (Roadblock/LC7/MglB family)|uniref:Uncharacterized protein n=1 Tax=Aetokthonos hydrillicola Thurmond2011 TaxID=2712845 RepID=A0AAP5I799_9CYAN|nr:hypothetical protein [Aetokthonos hydrillicola]MBO3458786.1 hypothetical protein [Aetokthonos hydrillicola CCALA 1050]MBW4585533.1 hypothetical protein [Aetokthonos hydrillicola CCALA 1050]MDR9896156.1 hypothetical protein [Aetokthonos hydrillicola Thurmond2011]
METKREKLDRIIKELVARRVGVQEAFVCYSEQLELMTTLIGEFDYDSIRKMAAKCILLARNNNQDFEGVIKVERETNNGYEILVPLTSYHCLFVKAIKSENDLPGELRIAINKTVERLKAVLNAEDSFDARDITKNTETSNIRSLQRKQNEEDTRWDQI